MNGIDKFMQVYEKHLSAVVSYPTSGYCYGIEEVPNVCAKMRVAILQKSHNKDGLAFKRTCKELSIPYTYTGIDAYMKGEVK
jgi:hypothetical protein